MPKAVTPLSPKVAAVPSTPLESSTADKKEVAGGKTPTATEMKVETTMKEPAPSSSNIVAETTPESPKPVEEEEYSEPNDDPITRMLSRLREQSPQAREELEARKAASPTARESIEGTGTPLSPKVEAVPDKPLESVDVKKVPAAVEEKPPTVVKVEKTKAPAPSSTAAETPEAPKPVEEEPSDENDPITRMLSRLRDQSPQAREELEARKAVSAVTKEDSERPKPTVPVSPKLEAIPKPLESTATKDKKEMPKAEAVDKVEAIPQPATAKDKKDEQKAVASSPKVETTPKPMESTTAKEEKEIPKEAVAPPRVEAIAKPTEKVGKEAPKAPEEKPIVAVEGERERERVPSVVKVTPEAPKATVAVPSKDERIRAESTTKIDLGMPKSLKEEPPALLEKEEPSVSQKSDWISRLLGQKEKENAAEPDEYSALTEKLFLAPSSETAAMQDAPVPSGVEETPGVSEPALSAVPPKAVEIPKPLDTTAKAKEEKEVPKPSVMEETPEVSAVSPKAEGIPKSIERTAKAEEKKEVPKPMEKEPLGPPITKEPPKADKADWVSRLLNQRRKEEELIPEPAAETVVEEVSKPLESATMGKTEMPKPVEEEPPVLPKKDEPSITPQRNDWISRMLNQQRKEKEILTKPAAPPEMEEIPKPTPVEEKSPSAIVKTNEPSASQDKKEWILRTFRELREQSRRGGEESNEGKEVAPLPSKTSVQLSSTAPVGVSIPDGELLSRSAPLLASGAVFSGVVGAVYLEGLKKQAEEKKPGKKEKPAPRAASKQSKRGQGMTDSYLSALSSNDSAPGAKKRSGVTDSYLSALSGDDSTARDPKEAKARRGATTDMQPADRNSVDSRQSTATKSERPGFFPLAAATAATALKVAADASGALINLFVPGEEEEKDDNRAERATESSKGALVREKATEDLSIPDDAAVKLAYEASNKIVDYATFKAEWEADAESAVVAKQPKKEEPASGAAAANMAVYVGSSSRPSTAAVVDEPASVASAGNRTAAAPPIRLPAAAVDEAAVATARNKTAAAAPSTSLPVAAIEEQPAAAAAAASTANLADVAPSSRPPVAAVNGESNAAAAAASASSAADVAPQTSSDNPSPDLSAEKAQEVTIEMLYDAAAKLAFEVSDKSVEYAIFRTEWDVEATLSMLYDAAPKLAYEATDKSLDFAAFQTEWEAKVNIDMLFDAATMLAYKMSDKSVDFADFKTEWESETVAAVFPEEEEPASAARDFGNVNGEVPSNDDSLWGVRQDDTPKAVRGVSDSYLSALPSTDPMASTPEQGDEEESEPTSWSQSNTTASPKRSSPTGSYLDRLSGGSNPPP